MFAGPNGSGKSTIIWIELGGQAAGSIVVQPYDRDKLKESVTQLRELTQSPLAVVIPKVRRILADAGVALVFMPIMKQAAFRGCTRLLTPAQSGHHPQSQIPERVPVLVDLVPRNRALGSLAKQ